MKTFFVVVVIYLIFGFKLGDSARILCVFQNPYISHQVVFRGLTLTLNKRGHELVVVTPNPMNDSTLANYREIDVSVLYEIDLDINFIDIRSTWTSSMKECLELQHTRAEVIFQHPEFQRLLCRQNNEKFDLLIIEINYSSAFHALAARFNVPIIGINSFGLTLHNHHTIGNPHLSSHPSTWEIGKSASYALPFWKRIENFIGTWLLLRFIETQFIPRQDEIAKKYLGNDIPYIGDIGKNISLVFVNHNPALSHIRPMVPNTIEIDGIHLLKQDQLPLPKDLKKFLDDATEGFVYMSLGSTVKGYMLSKSMREDFMAAFSKLPQRIIWKFEDDSIIGNPEKFYISKWLPQQAVLAHRNIKAFIYQGGLQSTEEAVNHAVPLLGLPIIFDQDSQVSKMVSLGVARSLEITDLNRHDLEEALRDVINNKSYKEKMLELRSLVNDKPYDALENAVWWTEFVIRHKGAPHLRCSTMDDPWYQRYDMDIIAFISIIALTIVIMSLFIAYRIIICSYSLLTSRIADRKQKRI